MSAAVGPRVADDALFADALGAGRALAWDLLGEGFDGLLAFAPSSVALDVCPTIPLLALRGGTTPALDTFHAAALIVGWSLEDDVLRVARARAAAPPPGGDAPSPAGAAETRAALPLAADARARLALPWRPGAHRLWVVHHGLASSPLDVDLLGDVAGAPPRDLEPLRPTPPDADGWPRSGPAAAAPAPPDAPGVRVALDPGPPGAAPVLRVGFHVATSPRRPRAAGAPGVVAVGVVTTFERGLVPARASYAVPATTQDEGTGEATGAFALPLGPSLVGPDPGRTFVWVVVSGVLAGPLVVQVPPG